LGKEKNFKKETMEENALFGKRKIFKKKTMEECVHSSVMKQS
jgi:hypothetical protein